MTLSAATAAMAGWPTSPLGRSPMTDPHDRPTLDDVIEPEEHATRDRTQHAKDPHPERRGAGAPHRAGAAGRGLDDADPAGAEEHAATD